MDRMEELLLIEGGVVALSKLAPQFLMKGLPLLDITLNYQGENSSLDQELTMDIYKTKLQIMESIDPGSVGSFGGFRWVNDAELFKKVNETFEFMDDYFFHKLQKKGKIKTE